MDKLKNSVGLILMAFLCAYTVSGISQSTNEEKRIVIVKKTIENGVEKIERSEYNSKDMSEEELERIVIAEEGNIDIRSKATKDGKEIEVTIGQDQGQSAFINDSMQKFLKEKGIALEDVSNLNINIDSSIENDTEVFTKEITVEDKEGKVHVFVLEGDELNVEELNGAHPHVNHKPKLGIMISAHDQGVMVEKIIEASPAEKAGLKKDDVIVAIDDLPVGTIDDLLSAMKSAEDHCVVYFIRDEEKVAVKVALTNFDFEGPAMQKKVIKRIEIDHN